MKNGEFLFTILLFGTAIFVSFEIGKQVQHLHTSQLKSQNEVDTACSKVKETLKRIENDPNGKISTYKLALEAATLCQAGK